MPSGSMSATHTWCATSTPPMETRNSPRPRNGSERPSARDMSRFTWSKAGCAVVGRLLSTLDLRIVTLAPVSTRNLTGEPWTITVTSGPSSQWLSVWAFTDGWMSRCLGASAGLRPASTAVPRFPAAVGLRPGNLFGNGRGRHSCGNRCSQQVAPCCAPLLAGVVLKVGFGHPTVFGEGYASPGLRPGGSSPQSVPVILLSNALPVWAGRLLERLASVYLPPGTLPARLPRSGPLSWIWAGSGVSATSSRCQVGHRGSDPGLALPSEWLWHLGMPALSGAESPGPARARTLPSS